MQIDCHLKVPLTEARVFHKTGEGSAKGRRCQVAIDLTVLPDVALLEIFHCYVNQVQEGHYPPEIQARAWHTLVHVCRKWRSIVFGSPLRLNLRLFCTKKTRVREMLAVWPPLPIVVWQNGGLTWGINNIMEALEYNDRICEITLSGVTSLDLEELFNLSPMQKPYPALTDLSITRWRDNHGVAPLAPESFLGGSAPCLRHLRLKHIPFPGLPKLLSSATHLITLYLLIIPNSGYFTPEAIVAGLSTSASLEVLQLVFESPLSRPKRETRHPPPLTRSILPALTRFRFQGASEYLEDLMARIDAPLLDNLEIKLFHQLIFDTPQLTRFISRKPNLKTLNTARVVLSGDMVRVTHPPVFPRGLELGISCRQSDWQLSSLAQIYSSVLPQVLIHTTEHLYICNRFLPPHWQDNIEDGQWLEILYLFTNVKNLYLSRELTRSIAPALQGFVGERVIEVLPALQSLFLGEVHPSGPVQEAIGKFVAARQLAGHPVIVSHWDREDE